MKQIFFLFLLIINVNILFGQTTVSPYSIFGPGELQNKGFSRTQSMGGVGIALKSKNYLNNINPASYTGIDSLRIVFEFGIKGKLYNIETSGKSNTGFTGNFNYMALGWRYTRWLAGSLSVVPFSSVGYSVIKSNYIQGTNETYTSQYVGSGGISQFNFANSVKLNKNLSLGLNASYMFGSLTQEENIAETNIVPAMMIKHQDFLKSLYFDYGLQYSFSTQNTNFTLGGIFSHKQSLHSRHILNIYNSSLSLINGEEFDTDYLTVPTTWGLGIAIEKTDKYLVMFDYSTQLWSGVSYPVQNYGFRNSHRFTLGTEFRIWDYRVVNASYKNWVYRFGLNYESSYLKFGSRGIDSKSISFGAGIPLPGSISGFNWGIEAGLNGTLASQLIKEKFVLLNLGFSLNEIAFVKRKFD